MVSGVHPGAILLFRGHLSSLESFLFVRRGQAVGILLNVLQCTGQTPQGRLIQPQISVVMRLRNSALVQLRSYRDMNFIVTVVFLGRNGVRVVPGGGISRPEPLMICVC